MIYRLEDLLSKMGAPEVRERQHIEWHYFDKKKNDLAGFAEIRLEAQGEKLVAELKRTRENYEDDQGALHAQFVETFHLTAERTASPDRYRVTRIAFDGDVYDAPGKAIVELGLSVFHARALDISIKMVEQTFNKSDILTPPVPGERLDFGYFITSAEQPVAKKQAPAQAAAQAPRKEGFGVVVPFRQRKLAV